MAALNYLVIEYFPTAMDHEKMAPARIDGHYARREMAEEIAALWAENPKHKESRIVVVEIQHEAKTPAHWLEHTA